MSSSGLIYAVIVGAWAAYLVPMWLRRQDELNEARPTERFSTAIRLLSGKAAMERRYARDAERREAEDFASGDSEEHAGQDDPAVPGDELADENDHLGEGTDESVDVRAFANPRTMIREAPADPPSAEPPAEQAASPARNKATAGKKTERSQAERGKADRPKTERGKAERTKAERTKAERTKRAKLLARRRRTTMVLFLAFTLGAVVAAVGGLAFLWAPAAPAALLSAYIVHLRVRERRRFVFTMDRRRAEAAARRLRESRTRSTAPTPQTEEADEPESVPARTQAHPHAGASVGAGAAGAGSGAAEGPAAEAHPAQGPAPAADCRALVERTDHAEWVDQERGRLREQPEGEGWDPVPVPLPTYVSAPVAPRTARSVDLDAPDAWSSARSSTAGAEPEPQPRPARPGAASAPPARERGRTPLFDQFEDPDRPRAANE